PSERWTIAQISAKLNPDKAPVAAPVTASTQSLPDVAKPAAPPPVGAATAKTASKDVAKETAPAQKKPAVAVDPLAVPLSKVEPLIGEKRHTLEHQVISGQGAPPARGYYLVVAVLLALTIGAMLAIPRFRSHPAEAQSAIASSEVTPSEPRSATTTAPLQVTPPDSVSAKPDSAPAKPQPKTQA